MLVSFDTKAELVSDLIADTEKLATAIRQLRPGGGTSLYDAIFSPAATSFRRTSRSTSSAAPS